MEYRRRRRRTNTGGLSDANAAYYIAAALFLGVVGLIGFSGPSTWVVKNWLAPAFSGATVARAADAQSEAAADAVVPIGLKTQTSVSVLPAYNCYALQIGVYEDAQNARAQSEALKRLGAAGRIVEDAGRHRVLASGYQSQQEAKAVQEQLLAEGIESYVYPVLCAEQTYAIEGDTAQAAVFRAAVEGVPDALAALYTAMLAFDREGLGRQEGLLPVRAVAETCSLHMRALNGLPADAGGQVAALLGFYRSVYDEAFEAAEMEEMETAAVSARLKALYLHAAYCREAL